MRTFENARKNHWRNEAAKKRIVMLLLLLENAKHELEKLGKQTPDIDLFLKEIENE
jgi:hypothetical protein